MVRIPSMFLSAVAAPFVLGGCQGPLVGNLVVLAVTVAIFVGTLGLGRTSSSASRSDSRSENRSTANPSQS
jgi:hypothetical protein